jgi:hypothetical protein
VDDSSDCNDSDATIYPGAPEDLTDGIDSNCDGDVDGVCKDDADCDGFNDVIDCDDTDPKLFFDSTFYEDADGDGYGNPSASTTVCGGKAGASPPAGYVDDFSDCDDTDAGVAPGAAEILGDGIDNNCDGVAS